MIRTSSSRKIFTAVFGEGDFRVLIADNCHDFCLQLRIVKRSVEQDKFVDVAKWKVYNKTIENLVRKDHCKTVDSKISDVMNSNLGMSQYMSRVFKNADENLVTRSEVSHYITLDD